jgi:hypothetical protein
LVRGSSLQVSVQKHSSRYQAPPPDVFRLSRASSWTFFISVCSGLQQTSQRSRFSSGISCLPSLAPLTLTCAHPRFWSASRRQQSQTNVVFVPMAVSRLSRCIMVTGGGIVTNGRCPRSVRGPRVGRDSIATERSACVGRMVIGAFTIYLECSCEAGPDNRCAAFSFLPEPS